MDFGKWNFLALVLKHFLYFFRFQETEPPPPQKKKKIIYISGKRNLKRLFVFQEIELFCCKKNLKKLF